MEGVRESLRTILLSRNPNSLNEAYTIAMQVRNDVPQASRLSVMNNASRNNQVQYNRTRGLFRFTGRFTYTPMERFANTLYNAMYVKRSTKKFTMQWNASHLSRCILQIYSAFHRMSFFLLFIIQWSNSSTRFYEVRVCVCVCVSVFICVCECSIHLLKVSE